LPIPTAIASTAPPPSLQLRPAIPEDGLFSEPPDDLYLEPPPFQRAAFSISWLQLLVFVLGVVLALSPSDSWRQNNTAGEHGHGCTPDTAGGHGRTAKTTGGHGRTADTAGGHGRTPDTAGGYGRTPDTAGGYSLGLAVFTFTLQRLRNFATIGFPLGTLLLWLLMTAAATYCLTFSAEAETAIRAYWRCLQPELTSKLLKVRLIRIVFEVASTPKYISVYLMPGTA